MAKEDGDDGGLIESGNTRKLLRAIREQPLEDEETCDRNADSGSGRWTRGIWKQRKKINFYT